MTYELSVNINGIADRAFAVNAALRFATHHQAHLTAVYVKLDEIQIRRWAGSSPLELANQVIADHNKRENDARSLFESIAAPYNCATTLKTVHESDDPFKQMMCTDFIFASQPFEDEFSHRPNDQFITNLLLRTKRPVILIPDDWNKKHIGEKIVIGWNDSTVAMRAVSDAMPILQSAKEVSLLKIVKQNRLVSPPNAYPDIRSYLDGKGITNTMLMQRDNKKLGEHEELIKFANSNNSDLIVIGGYSHSRLREVFFGGVTKRLLTQSNVPVLVSH